MSDLYDNDVFMNAFEPLATNGNRRNTKRRSSILKTDVNYGNEERRTSRRVSWAQTFQYKELLPDGTAVVMCQEFNHKTEETITSDPLPQIEVNDENIDKNMDKNIDQNVDQNVDQNANKTDDKIKASDFISRLKANTSINKSFTENTNKRLNTEELDITSDAKKPKKSKRNSSKGLTKYLSKHYEIDDQKDYETVFNTSVNKYGREVAPRDERPDFTQLFNDNNDMNLTKMTQISEELNQTDTMALTLNESFVSSTSEDVNKTRHFTDQSMAETTQSMAESTQNMAISECSEDSLKEEQISQTESDQQMADQTDFNRSFSVYSVESFRRTERQDLTQLFSNNSMNLTEVTEPLIQKKNKDFNEMMDEMNITRSELQEEVNKTQFFSNQNLVMTETTVNMTSNTNQSLIEDKTSDKTSKADKSLVLNSEETVAEEVMSVAEEEVSVAEEEISVVEGEESVDDEDNCDTNFNKTFNNIVDESETEETTDELQTKPTERTDLTQVFEEENNDMNLTAISEPSLENQESVEKTEDVMSFSEVSSKEVIDKSFMTECDVSMAISGITESIGASNPKNNDSKDTKDSPKADQELPEETNEEMLKESEEELRKEPEVSENLFSSKIPKPSISSRIPQLLTRKSIVPSIQLPAINKIPKSNAYCEQNRPTSKMNMGWLAQTTHNTHNNTTNLNNLTQTNQHLMEQSLRPTTDMTQTFRIGTHSSNTIFRRIERKSIQNTKSETQTTTEVITTTVDQMSNNERTESPAVTGKPLLAKSSVKRLNRQSLTVRLEMSKSAVKDMFGFGMTERLKQKRDEMEAKRRQSVVPNAFTPNASNSTVVSESMKTLAFNSTKNVSKLSTDLFSKTNIETEDMEVDNHSDSDNESNSKTTNTEVNSDNQSEEESEESNERSEVTKSEPNKDDVSKVESTESKSNTESSESNDTSVCESTTNSTSSSKSTSSASETSSLDLNSTSPLSVSIVHSSDEYLVSSPTAIDPTLNFTFNRSDSSNSFDPFIHTNQSFHTNHSFYETSSPMHLSFMVREDTLCVLADELERQIQDIVIPEEEEKMAIDTSESLNDMFLHLRRLDAKQNGFTYEVLSEEKALISYLWGTFALEIRFGSVVVDPNTCFTVRHILSINMKSLVSSEEPLRMRQRDLILKFNDSHKPLITIAHDLIISSFESERQQIINRHKTSASLHQLVSDISVKVLSAKKLLSELRIISSSEICRLYPKVDDRYRLVVEILGIRKPIYLVLPINPKSYPDEVIRPEIRIRNEDKHLYCQKQFSAAFLRIESRKFDYIRRLIRGTKAFVRAKKKIIYEKQKNLKQKNAIKSAKLPDSITKSSL